MSVLAKVKEFTEFLTRAETITKEMRFVEDLDMGEEDIVELVMNLEEEFPVDEFSVEDFDRITTVESLVEIVEEKIKVKVALEGDTASDESQVKPIEDDKSADEVVGDTEKNPSNPEGDKSPDEPEP